MKKEDLNHIYIFFLQCVFHNVFLKKPAINEVNLLLLKMILIILFPVHSSIVMVVKLLCDKIQCRKFLLITDLELAAIEILIKLTRIVLDEKVLILNDIIICPPSVISNYEPFSKKKKFD